MFKKRTLYFAVITAFCLSMLVMSGCSGQNDESVLIPIETPAAPAVADNQQTGVSDSVRIIEAANAYLTSDKGKTPTISVQDVYNKIVKGGDSSYFLVSVQKPEDYAKGHVPGAVNIPFSQIAKKENLAKLPKDKKLVIICYTGHTASYTSMFLNELGYEAYVMKFGTMAWNDTTAGLGASFKPYTESADLPVDTSVAEAPAANELPVVSTGQSSPEDVIIAATDAYLSSDKGKVPTISVQDVNEKVVKGGDTGYLLLSVQKPEDYAKGHVPGAINIPFNQIAREENLKKLPRDKKIVTICYTGHTASYTAMLLNQLGYEAYSMKFGTMAWNDKTAGLGASFKPYVKSAGYEVSTGSNP